MEPRRHFSILPSNYPTEAHDPHQHQSSASSTSSDLPRRHLRETTGNVQQQQHQQQQQQQQQHQYHQHQRQDFSNGNGALDILPSQAADHHAKRIEYLTPQPQSQHQHSQHQQLSQTSVESISASASAQAQAQAQHRRTVAARLEQRRNRHAHQSHHHADRGSRHDEERPAAYLQSTAYQQYRARQRRDAGDGDAVWPDALEDVFHKALQEIPCLGRRKLPMRGKMWGTNELIADYILKHTRAKRSRKQVSSHIQVLKGFLKDCPSFMKLVTPAEDSRISNEKLKRIADRLQPRGSRYDSLHLNTNPEDYAHPISNSQPTLPSSSSLLSPPHTNDTIHPLNFTMWVQPPNQHRRVESSVHIYTSLSPLPPQSPTPLESLRNWRDAFPCLASLVHSPGGIGADTSLLLLESSLNMTAPASDYTGWELGTAFEILASPLYAGHEWHYTTTIYECGERVENHTATLPHADMGYGDGTVKLQPSLLPRFWAPRFVVWDKERGQLAGSGGEGGEREGEERVKMRVRRMSAVQELYASDPKDARAGVAAKRVAILCWKFSKAVMRGEGGNETTWRVLVPPPGRRGVMSPTPRTRELTTGWDGGRGASGAGLGLYGEDAATGRGYESQGQGEPQQGGVYQGLDGTLSPAETLPTSPTPGGYHYTGYSGAGAADVLSASATGGLHGPSGMVDTQLESLYQPHQSQSQSQGHGSQQQQHHHHSQQSHHSTANDGTSSQQTTTTGLLDPFDPHPSQQHHPHGGQGLASIASIMSSQDQQGYLPSSQQQQQHHVEVSDSQGGYSSQHHYPSIPSLGSLGAGESGGMWQGFPTNLDNALGVGMGVGGYGGQLSQHGSQQGPGPGYGYVEEVGDGGSQEGDVGQGGQGLGF